MTGANRLQPPPEALLAVLPSTPQLHRPERVTGDLISSLLRITSGRQYPIGRNGSIRCRASGSFAGASVREDALKGREDYPRIRSLSAAIARRRPGLRWATNSHSFPVRRSTLIITSRSAGPLCMAIAVQSLIARVSGRRPFEIEYRPGLQASVAGVTDNSPGNLPLRGPAGKKSAEVAKIAPGTTAAFRRQIPGSTASPPAHASRTHLGECPSARSAMQAKTAAQSRQAIASHERLLREAMSPATP